MRRVLIVIDMQNDFIDGALGSEEAVNIVPNVINKVNEYVNNNDWILFTVDTHDADTYLDTHEGKLLPIPHCIHGTNGWRLRDGVFPKGYNRCGAFVKHTFGTDWKGRWTFEKADEIEIVGLCTDICVISNALILRALYPDADMKVDSRCCAGTTPEMHEAALRVMKSNQIEVIE